MAKKEGLKRTVHESAQCMSPLRQTGLVQILQAEEYQATDFLCFFEPSWSVRYDINFSVYRLDMRR